MPMFTLGSNINRRYKIKGLPTHQQLEAMPFGRQIEHLRSIEAFKSTAKSVWISMKRRSAASAIKEAKALYDVDEYYCQYYDSTDYWDDSFEFFYTTK